MLLTLVFRKVSMKSNTSTSNSQELSSASLSSSAVLDTLGSQANADELSSVPSSFVISVLFDQPNTLNNLITANYPSPSGARRA